MKIEEAVKSASLKVISVRKPINIYAVKIRVVGFSATNGYNEKEAVPFDTASFISGNR